MPRRSSFITSIIQVPLCDSNTNTKSSELIAVLNLNEMSSFNLLFFAVSFNYSISVFLLTQIIIDDYSLSGFDDVDVFTQFYRGKERSWTATDSISRLILFSFSVNGLNNENVLGVGMNRDVPIPTDESEETDQIVGGTKVDSPKRFPYMVIFSFLIWVQVL